MSNIQCLKALKTLLNPSLNFEQFNNLFNFIVMSIQQIVNMLFYFFVHIYLYFIIFQIFVDIFCKYCVANFNSLCYNHNEQCF